MADKKVSAEIDLTFKAQSMGAIQQAMRNTVHSLNRVEEAIEKSNAAWGTFGDVGTSMIEVSQGLVDSAKDLSGQYVERFGMMEKTSAQWIQSTLRLEQAQFKMGRAATEALQPIQDQLVKIIETVANFIEKNPELMQMAVGAASTLLASGTAMAGISKAILSINQLRSSMMALKGIGGMGGMAMQGLGAAGVLGAGAIMAPDMGLMLGKWLNRVLGKQGSYQEAVQEQKKGDVAESAAKAFVTASILAANGMKELYKALLQAGKGLQDFADDITHPFKKEAVAQRSAERQAFIDEEIGRLEENMATNAGVMAQWADTISERMAGTAGPGGGPLGLEAAITTDMLNEYENFLLEMEQADEQYQFQLEQQKTEHNRQMLMMEEDFNRQQRQAREDYEREQQVSLDDYNRQQAISLRDFNRDQALSVEEYRIEEMRSLKDYHLQRQRAEEDHRRSIMDSAARLDALAVIQEQRQFAIDSRRSEQDFNKERAQNQANFRRQQMLAQQNFNIQMQDAKDNFDIQQQLAKENYEIMMARAEEEYEIQRSRAEEEFRYQQSVQEAQYRKERQLREEQYRKMIDIQTRQYTMTAEQADAHYAELRSGFLGFVGDLKGGLKDAQDAIEDAADTYGRTSWESSPYFASATSRYQTGGYTEGGLGLLHPGEFVMTPGTTRAMERQIGGKLTQGNIMRAGNSMAVSISNVFNDVGQHSVAALQRMVEEGTRTALKGVIKDYVS